jgi:hypothetical protein
MNLSHRLVYLALAGALFTTAARAELTAPVPADGYSSSTLSRREAVKHADRPSWAVELAGSPLTFGGQGLVPGRPEAESMSTSLQIEYQPTFIQRFGTLGLGPVFSAFPVSQGQGVTSGFFSVWAIGATVRYQGRFTHNQFLVPSIGYEADRMRYSFLTGQQGSVTLSGPVAGLEFLLNALDPSRGADMYENTGISHCYLVGEVRDLTGSDSTITASGLSAYFGLRFEM